MTLIWFFLSNKTKKGSEKFLRKMNYKSHLVVSQNHHLKLSPWVFHFRYFNPFSHINTLQSFTTPLQKSTKTYFSEVIFLCRFIIPFMAKTYSLGIWYENWISIFIRERVEIKLLPADWCFVGVHKLSVYD